MQKSQYKQIALDKIIEGRNVRLVQYMNVPELAADIGANGLNVRPKVVAIKDGFEIISGHRRIRAIKHLKDNDPVAYAEHFKNGMVDVEVLTGISYEEAQFLKIDHGNEQPLKGLELQNCANMLFDFDLSEKQVVVRLASLLDRVMPMKANAKKKLADMQVQLDQLIALKSEPKLIAAKQAEIVTAIFEYRRGAVQNLHNTYRSPSIVMAALYYKETGEYPDGFDKSVPLPARITTSDITKAYKAFATDLEETDESGVRKYNKELPGPVFGAKWAEILNESKQKEDAQPGDRNKSKSYKDLEAESKSKWVSTGFQLLTQHHMNKDVEVGFLKTEDKMLFFAEILSERAPDAWAEAVALAQNLIKGVAAENKEIELSEAAAK